MNTEECWTTWLQTPLASAMVDFPWQQDFARGVHALDVFSMHINSAKFRVVFVVVVAFSLSFIDFSLFFFFSVVISKNCFVGRNSLGVHVGWYVIRSTTTRCVDLPSRPLARELDFSVLTGFKPSRDGVDNAKACLVPLKRKTWAWGMSPKRKFNTPANSHKLAQSKSSRAEGFLMSLGGPLAVGQPLLSKWKGHFDTHWTSFGGQALD